MVNMYYNFPQLEYFLNAYMHQDWDADSNTLEDVIYEYKKETSAQDVIDFRKEIETLLTLSVDEIEETYNALYPNSVLPSGWGMTPQHWLRHVANVAMEHRPNGPKEEPGMEP